MAPNSIRRLEYSPATKSLSWHRRLRWAIFGAAAVGFAAAGWQGLSTWRRAKAVYWQRACMMYAAPPERIVYDDDPLRAAALLSADPALCDIGTRSHPVAGRTAKCWDRFYQNIQYASARARPEAVLFMHALRSSVNANPQLVVVVFERLRDGSFAFGAYIPHPGTLTELPSSCEWGSQFYLPEIGVRSIRFYAGQVDSTDGSHFTVLYEMDGQRGTLDGWWHEGEFKVQFRDGPAATTAPSQSAH